MEKFRSLDTQKPLSSRARILALLAGVGLSSLPGCSYTVANVHQSLNGAEISVHKVNDDVEIKCNDLAKKRGMTALVDGVVYKCPPKEEGWGDDEW